MFLPTHSCMQWDQVRASFSVSSHNFDTRKMVMILRGEPSLVAYGVLHIIMFKRITVLLLLFFLSHHKICCPIVQHSDNIECHAVQPYSYTHVPVYIYFFFFLLNTVTVAHSTKKRKQNKISYMSCFPKHDLSSHALPTHGGGQGNIYANK